MKKILTFLAVAAFTMLFSVSVFAQSDKFIGTYKAAWTIKSNGETSKASEFGEPIVITPAAFCVGSKQFKYTDVKQANRATPDYASDVISTDTFNTYTLGLDWYDENANAFLPFSLKVSANPIKTTLGDYYILEIAYTNTLILATRTETNTGTGKKTTTKSAKRKITAKSKRHSK